MTSPSMRRALLLRCGIGVGILLCLLSAGTYLTVRHGLYRELDQSLRQTAALLSNQVELKNEGITFEWQEGLGTNRAIIDNGLFQFWNEASGETTRSPGLQARDLPQFYGLHGAPLLQDIRLPGSRRHARAIGLRVYPFVLPAEAQRMQQLGHPIDPKSLPHTLVVARDAKPVHRVLTRMRWILATGMLLTLSLVFAFINRAVLLALRPIDRLTRQVRDRAGHQLDSALDVPGELPAELTGLAANFDLLLARLAATRQRERDFIRHAAHELRTPIAAMLATTELALSKSRGTTAYVSHLTTCRNAAVKLGELVQRLTELARIGQATSPPVLEAIDLEPLIDDCLQPYLPVFQQRGLQVARSTTPPLPPVWGDRTLVRIVVNNLLDNAASHAPQGDKITIGCHHTDGHVEMSVANSAEDLPDDLDRLFEPLFRRENPHNHQASHLGIGLALSQEAATALGATLQARRTDPAGIAFLFTLAAAPP